MRIEEKLQKWIGKTVVIEGTFPIPVGNGQVAYAPAKGVLEAVFGARDSYDVTVDGPFSDNGPAGIAVREEGSTEPTIFILANLRSVSLMSEVAVSRVKIFTPGH